MNRVQSSPPSLQDIRAARDLLGDRIRVTPVWNWECQALTEQLGSTRVGLKLELFQHTGTFKARGALLNALSLSETDRSRGLTAVSAGNHAIAVAWAANILGTRAKVVMPRSASPMRVEKCRAWGGEVVLVDDVHQAFDEVHRIEDEEGMAFVHPFEGVITCTGTATLGLEWGTQAPELDAVIIPIGGGGLCAGVSCAIKQLNPDCEVFGVEPVGADTMHRSFASGKPESIDKVRTIADSLGAPYAAPYSFSLCQRYVDELVMIDDDMMRQAMRLLFDEAKLGVEPAGAAATAGLLGPLRERLEGKNVGVLVCGSNIDLESFNRYAGESGS